jgi:hypothetical protein
MNINNLLRASPAIKVTLAIEKVQPFTLATVFLLYTPTNPLFYTLLWFKYYFLFLLFFFFANTRLKENKRMYHTNHHISYKHCFNKDQKKRKREKKERYVTFS